MGQAKLNRNKTFHLGELFCGPGGLAYGATHASIENPDNPESVICHDVRTLDLTQFKKGAVFFAALHNISVDDSGPTAESLSEPNFVSRIQINYSGN